MNPREYLKFAGELKGVPRKKLPGEVERVMGLTGITHMACALLRTCPKGTGRGWDLPAPCWGTRRSLFWMNHRGLDPRQIIEIRELIKSLGKSIL
mgnify:CR=1 FL=1